MLCGTAKKTHTFSFYIKIHCEALGNNENMSVSRKQSKTERDDSETARIEGQLHSMEAVKRRITLCSSPARFFNMILADI